MARKKSAGMMGVPSLDNDADDWAARSDATTLADAHRIRSDAGRHGKAVEAAKRMVSYNAAAAADKPMGTRSGIEPAQDHPVGHIKPGSEPKKPAGHRGSRGKSTDAGTKSGSAGR